ncbi:MAG: hypothetical protein P8O84_01565 [Synechococcus sp. cluster3_bin.96]|nr:hypothetical protein [Synechococcus sp. cluster3_bin.96]
MRFSLVGLESWCFVLIMRPFIRELKDKFASFLMPAVEDVVSLCDVSKLKHEFACGIG